jgi:hypothetical protein
VPERLRGIIPGIDLLVVGLQWHSMRVEALFIGERPNDRLQILVSYTIEKPVMVVAHSRDCSEPKHRESTRTNCLTDTNAGCQGFTGYYTFIRGYMIA